MIDQKIAAARAFLEAGDTRLALQHADEVLRQEPENPHALAVHADTLLKLADFARLETLAVDWIGRAPWAPEPHAYLFACYMKRGDRRMARSLLDHFRSIHPGPSKQRDHFEAAFETRFGTPAAGPDRLAGIYAADGDRRAETRATSLVPAHREGRSVAAPFAGYLTNLPFVGSIFRRLQGRVRTETALSDY
jgi:hypothetical protein